MLTGKHARGRDRRNRKFLIILTITVVLVAAIVVCFLVSYTRGFSTEESVENPETIAEQKSEEQVEESNQESADAASTFEQSEQMATAESAVATLVETYSEDVAVVVLPLDGSLGFSINGEEKFISASMIKLLILAEYLDEVDSGKLDSDAVYTKNLVDVVGGTGVIQNEAPGTEYTYDDLARYMIMYSDNTATNALIDLMGMDAINAKARDLGLVATDLQRKMMDLNLGVENHISAGDAAIIFSGIATHTIASEKMCKKAEEWLLEQTDNNGIIDGLPSGIRFGHKTGDLNNIRHDGGIVYADYPYVIVVLADTGSFAANSLMSKISAAVYESIA